MLMKMVTKRKDATTNTIIMTIADHRWQDLVVNWMACLHRLRLSNYIIISADPQLHDALGRIGAPSFYRSVFFNPYSGSGGGGDGGAKGDRYRGAVWSYRWQLIGSVLKRGVHVVHIDIDALLVRNFAPMLQALVGAGSGGVFGSSSSSSSGGGGVATRRMSPLPRNDSEVVVAAEAEDTAASRSPLKSPSATHPLRTPRGSQALRCLGLRDGRLPLLLRGRRL